ncbi:hypothetical protein ATS71_06080 [Pseudoalteromonas sp. H71]|nr:hypothetical protein ATS71_06080 [Pseudoalteromonas sp. H71]
MWRVTTLLTYLMFSGNAISQTPLTLEEQKKAEVYANYVSSQAFVELCSKFEAVNTYKDAFKQWTNINQNDIQKGQSILSRHYSSQKLEINEVFKWKTDAEIKYFKAASKPEKIEACKNLLVSVLKNAS